MRDPVCKSVRVVTATTLSDKTVGATTTLSKAGAYAKAHPRKHARIPPEVYSDPGLTASDVRVFAVLAEFERGGVASVGMRLIGSTVHLDPANVSRSMGRLVRSGHIAKSSVASGKRQSYELLSPIFQRATADNERTEQAIRPSCAKCGKIRRVNKACYCYKCAKIASEVARIKGSLARLTA